MDYTGPLYEALKGMTTRLTLNSWVKESFKWLGSLNSQYPGEKYQTPIWKHGNTDVNPPKKQNRQ